MLQKLTLWWNKPSQWWQVWMPRSGWFGGLTIGLAIAVLCILAGCGGGGDDGDGRETIGPPDCGNHPELCR